MRSYQYKSADLTCTWIRIIKIRRPWPSYLHNGNPIHKKTVLTLTRGPDSRKEYPWNVVPIIGTLVQQISFPHKASRRSQLRPLSQEHKPVSAQLLWLHEMYMRFCSALFIFSFNVKTVFPGLDNTTIKKRLSWDRLIFIMGIIYIKRRS